MMDSPDARAPSRPLWLGDSKSGNGGGLEYEAQGVVAIGHAIRVLTSVNAVRKGVSGGDGT